MIKKLFFAIFILFIFISASCKKNSTDVVIETSVGNIQLELFDSKSPETVKNFLKYVDEKFYDGTIFHRVIPNFMIQGGGFDQEMKQKQTHPPIKNEALNKVSNEKGTIAMARTNDPHSATSQFFINTNNNTFLDHGHHGFGYCVFGKVSGGMDIVDKISSTETTENGYHRDVPVENIIIYTIKRKQ